MSNVEWYAYEVRSIDAIGSGEDEQSWEWNASYKIGEGKIREVSKRTVADALRRCEVKFKKGTVVWTTNDDCLFELVDKQTLRPLYAVIVDGMSTVEREAYEKELLSFPRILNCIQCGSRFKADKYADYCPNCKGV